MCVNKSLMLNCYCHISILEFHCMQKKNKEHRFIKKCYQKNVNKLYISMYKPDLALNNPQWLICHKTKPNPQEGVNNDMECDLVETLTDNNINELLQKKSCNFFKHPLF